MIFEIEYIDGFDNHCKKYIQCENKKSVKELFRVHCPAWKILSIKTH